MIKALGNIVKQIYCFVVGLFLLFLYVVYMWFSLLKKSLLADKKDNIKDILDFHDFCVLCLRKLDSLSRDILINLKVLFLEPFDPIRKPDIHKVYAIYRTPSLGEIKYPNFHSHNNCLEKNAGDEIYMDRLLGYRVNGERVVVVACSYGHTHHCLESWLEYHRPGAKTVIEGVDDLWDNWE